MYCAYYVLINPQFTWKFHLLFLLWLIHSWNCAKYFTYSWISFCLLLMSRGISLCQYRIFEFQSSWIVFFVYVIIFPRTNDPLEKNILHKMIQILTLFLRLFCIHLLVHVVVPVWSTDVPWYSSIAASLHESIVICFVHRGALILGRYTFWFGSMILTICPFVFT